MILSRGRRFIFIHIPKTGGTALALALEARAMKDDILIGDTPKARARKGRWQGVQSHGRLWKHSTLADIAGLASDDEIAAFFTFTLIRNPWDRAVSYYHWLRGQSFAHPAVSLAQCLDFTAFTAHPQTRAAFRASPARSYLTDRFGQERASAYVRLEHLTEDLAPVEAHLGFRLGPLPQANESSRARDWRGYFTYDTAQMVATDSAEDIARFGYCFDP
ncbi:MAG: Type II secretory pathway, pullulanase PulA [Rhodobacterales bacterium 65-51]|jgi:hypothetical protein|uniref:sulfotransferase family 2 domain-containing protein n=1 Tax=uncultured Gemmobacter sp. TaxID=1095917 RepID=UPI000969F286|nr:sulfotransferase family 2 domain-containing protein [uncultured Gemmobacter sp.]OJY33399.1 MAG: Type II secretory pathway, pullulanase PulA [Rhodobacterales bacterium 65-51]